MFKNKLQEYCQKNGLDLPIYETNDGFISTVSIILENKCKLSGTGNIKKKKKASEISAAKKLIEVLKTYLEKNKITFVSELPTRILIDLENVNLDKLFDKYNFKNYIFDVFISNEDCLKKLGKYRDNVNIYRVKSSRRDAADILMVLELGTIIAKSSQKLNVIVFTHDHFGDALMDCLNNYACYFQSYKCINSINELIEIIK